MKKTTNKSQPKGKKKVKKRLTTGKIYIQSSFNNTIVTVCNEKGEVVTWSSCGSIGFKGTKKSTPYAAQLAATQAVEKSKAQGLTKADIFVSGVGSGRESAVRALINSRIQVDNIKDITPIPHNGCRAKKSRRV